MTKEKLTEYDLNMLIEVLDGLEQSYNLDIKDGKDRTKDSELIPWTKHVRTILAQILESSNGLEWSKSSKIYKLDKKSYEDQDRSYHPKTTLDEYFFKLNMRKQNPALELFHQIMEHVECRCNENEYKDLYVIESCFACREVGELIAKLHKDRWIKE